MFAVNGDIRNDEEREANLDGRSGRPGHRSATRTARSVPDGAIDARRRPTRTARRWVSSKNRPAAANCMYLIRAEQRFGNGDDVFTIDEQTNAINALYDVARGEQQHLGVGRRARLGFEINF